MRRFVPQSADARLGCVTPLSLLGVLHPGLASRWLAFFLSGLPLPTRYFDKRFICGVRHDPDRSLLSLHALIR
jgi:hypothetical protein